MLDATLVMDNPHIRRSRIHGRQRIAVLPDGIVVRLGIVEGDWEIAEEM